MITYEDEILQKVLKQFDGLAKIDAYDLLQKVEILLQGQKSPIEYRSIRKELDKQFFKNEMITIGKSGYCYLVDYCHFIKIYKFKSAFFPFTTRNSFYYTLYHDYKMKQLTNKNIIETFKNTHLRYVIHHFLKDNRVQKKNSKTNRLLLLELLDEVDPER
ncbi:hypothetical protein [Aquimarina latercula]|uniref:hypothetical protein n=1 Tax=Aquimarina latercula TaxID=987 RepID=UPI0004060A92|nr:hypothetical protein [Aquimarina latercula]